MTIQLVYERLTSGELLHRLGEIETFDTEGTQNALIILVQLVQDQAQKINVLQAEVEHLEEIVQGQEEILCTALERARIHVGAVTAPSQENP